MRTKIGLVIVFTLLMLTVATQSTLAAIKMTPYLQAVTGNSIYVLVESDSTSTVTVNYGLTNSYGSNAATESTEATNGTSYIHNIKLTGLQPNTLYHYRATQGASASADSTFYTAVNPGTAFRFAWMADCRTGTSVHDSISTSIKNANPRFSLYGGDLCIDSTYTAFKNEFFRPNELALIAQVPFFNSPGNHELWSTNTMAFTQAPVSASNNQGYYSFDYGDMHVLVLNFQDSSWSNIQGSAQYNFAKADLQATTKTWKIVSLHSPAYCSGGHGEDASTKTLCTDIFEPNKVDMVLTGHSHFYQHNKVNNIHHMVIGAAGATLHDPTNASYTIKSVKDNCYALVDVTNTTFNMTVYNASNSILETINLSKSLSSPTPTPTPISTPTPTPTPTSASDKCTGGTISVSNTNSPSGEDKTKAFDDSSSTKWLIANGAGWIQYDFAGAIAWPINQYTITSANDYPARDPKNWTLQGSNDGTNWVTVDTQTNQSFANRFQKNTYTCNNYNAIAYQMYRLNVSANGGDTNLQIAEIEMFATGAGVTFYQNADWGGTASQKLGKGNYTMAQLNAMGCPNDWMSSLKVPSGWTVIVYQNDNFGGTSWTFTADSSYVGSACNDQMSSCKIQ